MKFKGSVGRPKGANVELIDHQQKLSMVDNICHLSPPRCKHDYREKNTTHWLQCIKCGDRISKGELQNEE